MIAILRHKKTLTLLGVILLIIGIAASIGGYYYYTVTTRIPEQVSVLSGIKTILFASPEYGLGTEEANIVKDLPNVLLINRFKDEKDQKVPDTYPTNNMIVPIFKSESDLQPTTKKPFDTSTIVLVESKNLSLCTKLYQKCIGYIVDTQEISGKYSSDTILSLNKITYSDTSTSKTVLEIRCKDTKELACINLFLGIEQSDIGTDFISIRNSIGELLNPLIYTAGGLTSSYKKDGGHLFFWQNSQKTPRLKQNSYSLAVKNETNNIPIILDKSGRLFGEFNAIYFFPTQEISATDLTASLQVWYTYNNEPLLVPLTQKIKFSNDLKPSNLSAYTKDGVELMGWIPDWGTKDGIASLTKYKGKYSTISPVWFHLNKDGTLEVSGSVNNASILQIAKAQNIRVIPTISQFDPDFLSEVLNKNMDKHIDTIINAIDTYNLSGIDLDYESTYIADKDKWKEFVEKLSTRLKAKNKTFIYTVLVKFTDEKVNNYLPQTKELQDWEFLGKHVDELHIMAYDYTSRKSLAAGPMSPLLWNEAVLQYAITKLPANKIVLGLPTYGFGWTITDSDPAGPNNDKNIYKDTPNSFAIQLDEVRNVRAENKTYKDSYDSWNGELRAEFILNKTKRVQYILDKQSIEQRMKLAKKYGIKGLIFWRLGGEELP